MQYYYDFDQLKSFNETILSDPLISIDTKGKVPRKARVFQVFLPCLGNRSGVASFGIGLRIQNDRGSFLPGTPLRFKLQKHCADYDRPDPECDKKCANEGRCNQERICECPKGYMGKYCESGTYIVLLQLQFIWFKKFTLTQINFKSKKIYCLLGDTRYLYFFYYLVWRFSKFQFSFEYRIWSIFKEYGRTCLIYQISNLSKHWANSRWTVESIFPLICNFQKHFPDQTE